MDGWMDGWRFDLYSAFHQDLKALNKTAKKGPRPMLISSLVTDRKEKGERTAKGRRCTGGEGGQWGIETGQRREGKAIA